MAAAADSSSTAHSPLPRRNGRKLPSPWSHVVRGEPDPASPSSPPPPSPPAVAASTATSPPEASDRSPPVAGAASDDPPVSPPPPDGGDHGAVAATPAREKKSVWSRPSNGVAEAEPVMGAVSWPALSEATKASPKSSSSDSLKALSDGSVFAPPVPVDSSPPSKPTSNVSNSNSSTNYAAPACQKSVKRGGGGGSGGTIAGKGGAALPNGRSAPSVTPPASAEVPQSSSGKVGTSEPSVKDVNNKGGNWDHGPRGGGGFPSQLHGGNEHLRSYGGNKRGNNAGGGPHHNLGSRRDQERGAYDWNHRTFGSGRDVQVQQRPQHQPRPMARPFLRSPPLVPAPFIAPPPRVSPFGNPIGYTDIPSPLFYVPTPPSPESLGGIPFVTPPATFFAAPDPQLQAVLAKQIDYYFSPENLCKDIYLRQNMDDEGWVPISLIAGFNRVRNLTNNIQFILDAVKASPVVEVQGDRIRRRNDWMIWPPLASASNAPHSSVTPSYDSLAARVGNVGLGEGNRMGSAIPTEVVLSGSLGELNGHSSMVVTSNGDRSGQSTVQTGSDRSYLQEV